MNVSGLLGGLIVSCQAPDDSPLRRTDMMVLMARAAIAGGATGIRAQGVDDIRAIAAVTDLPIIGLKKAPPLTPDRVYITPRFADAAAVFHAGAGIIALDGTARARPGGETLRTIIARIHDELGALVMADIDSAASAEYAAACGADVVGTTMVGYTNETLHEASDSINLRVVAEVAAAVDVPVIAEGRIWTPDDARAARTAGASGIVVGTAITNPVSITRRFCTALQRA
jgi:N-acylglucosamine-6-phosphate 2-epimerase